MTEKSIERMKNVIEAIKVCIYETCIHVLIPCSNDNVFFILLYNIGFRQRGKCGFDRIGNRNLDCGVSKYTPRYKSPKKSIHISHNYVYSTS